MAWHSKRRSGGAGAHRNARARHHLLARVVVAFGQKGGTQRYMSATNSGWRVQVPHAAGSKAATQGKAAPSPQSSRSSSALNRLRPQQRMHSESILRINGKQFSAAGLMCHLMHTDSALHSGRRPSRGMKLRQTRASAFRRELSRPQRMHVWTGRHGSGHAGSGQPTRPQHARPGEEWGRVSLGAGRGRASDELQRRLRMDRAHRAASGHATLHAEWS